MTIQTQIEEKLQTLSPDHFEVINESASHNVPPGSESHFKLIVVSQAFEGKSLINRHKLINQLLAEELQGPVHALSMHTLTPPEWFEKYGKIPESPPCMGGSASDG